MCTADNVCDAVCGPVCYSVGVCDPVGVCDCVTLPQPPRAHVVSHAGAGVCPRVGRRCRRPGRLGPPAGGGPGGAPCAAAARAGVARRRRRRRRMRIWPSGGARGAEQSRAGLGRAADAHREGGRARRAAGTAAPAATGPGERRWGGSPSLRHLPTCSSIPPPRAWPGVSPQDLLGWEEAKGLAQTTAQPSPASAPCVGLPPRPCPSQAPSLGTVTRLRGERRGLGRVNAPTLSLTAGPAFWIRRTPFPTSPIAFFSLPSPFNHVTARALSQAA